MITDVILNAIFGIVNVLLLPLEVINFGVDIITLEPVIQFFKMAVFLIPVAQLMPIFLFFVSMMGFRIVVSIIKTIWDLLPIV